MAERELAAAQHTIQLGLAFIPARAVYVAAKLGIADLIETAPLSAAELAPHVGADPGALQRILRVLAAIGLLQQGGDGRFSLTTLGETLRAESPQSVRDYLILNHELPYKSFDNILHSVRTGDSAFAETFGAPIFQLLQADPAAAAVFHAGLRSRARIEIAALLDAYDFSGAGRIVDIGGGTGALLSAILTRFGGVSGVLFDAESVIRQAGSGPAGSLPGCELVAGDFFATVPPGGDVYILKYVLHDWYDDDAVRILQKCREVMSPSARLLIIEGLIEPGDALTMTDIVDLTMLVSVGGMERTRQEYDALLQQAGFGLERVVPTAAAPAILEARPC